MIKKIVQLVLISPNLINFRDGFLTPSTSFNPMQPSQRTTHFKGINPLNMASKSSADSDNLFSNKKLNEIQLKGIEKFKLHKKHVVNSSYNINIYNMMLYLEQVIPQAKGEYLYETAMKMKSHQIDGILKHQLTLAQVGIGISGGFLCNKNQRIIIFQKKLLKVSIILTFLI